MPRTFPILVRSSTRWRARSGVTSCTRRMPACIRRSCDVTCMSTALAACSARAIFSRWVSVCRAPSAPRWRDPAATVVACVGDGALMLSLGDLLTAAREGVDLIVVVFNDGAYGLIQRQQLMTFGHEHATSLLNPDFAVLAQAIGCGYFSVANDGAAASAVGRCIARTSPGRGRVQQSDVAPANCVQERRAGKCRSQIAAARTAVAEADAATLTSSERRDEKQEARGCGPPAGRRRSLSRFDAAPPPPSQPAQCPAVAANPARAP